MENDEGSETIKVSDLQKFIIDCFCTVGIIRTNSEIIADSLIFADSMGLPSHGVFRLERIIRDTLNGMIDIHGEPVIIKETPSTAWVDGRNSFGCTVGTFCMKIAIEKAKQVGAAIVTANNSNNFGVASYYCKQALREGFIGLSFSNSSPLMVPTRGKEEITGTNPISIMAPGLFGDDFSLDMATSVTAAGNIDMKYREGKSLPVGWAYNNAFLTETNAEVALKSHKFLPLGSYEELSSYKGTGLSIMIDILCGVLSGAHYSHRVGAWIGRLVAQKANVGHCFIVIDPKRFAPDFEVRLSEFTTLLRQTTCENPTKPVNVPGDKGKELLRRIEKEGGIAYPKYVINSLKDIAIQLKVNLVPFLPKKQKLHMTPSEELAARLESEQVSMVPASVPATEDSISMTDNSLIVEDKSLIMEDSSDWLCPIDILSSENIEATSWMDKKMSIKQSTAQVTTMDIDSQGIEIVRIDDTDSIMRKIKDLVDAVPNQEENHSYEESDEEESTSVDSEINAERID